MHTKLGLALLLLASRSARADDYRPYAVSPGPAPEPAPFVERGYLGGGAGLTVDHFGNLFVDLEGGVRIARGLPVWLRGSAAIGKSADVEGGGDYRRFVAGVETRGCRPGPGACAYVGLDAGVQTQTWSKIDEMTEHHRGFVYGARGGVDVGGEQTRFRLGLEIYRYDRGSDVDGLADASQFGGGLVLGVVRRL